MATSTGGNLESGLSQAVTWTTERDPDRAIAAFTALMGLASVIFIFRFRSFKEVLHAGRASRDAERAAEQAGVLLGEDGARLSPRPFDEDPPTPPGAQRRRGARARY